MRVDVATLETKVIICNSCPFQHCYYYVISSSKLLDCVRSIKFSAKMTDSLNQGISWLNSLELSDFLMYGKFWI